MSQAQHHIQHYRLWPYEHLTPVETGGEWELLHVDGQCGISFKTLWLAIHISAAKCRSKLSVKNIVKQPKEGEKTLNHTRKTPNWSCLPHFPTTWGVFKRPRAFLREKKQEVCDLQGYLQSTSTTEYPLGNASNFLSQSLRHSTIKQIHICIVLHKEK